MFTNRYKNKKFNKNAPPPRPIIKYNPPPKKQSILSNIGQSFTWGVGMGAGSEMGHSVFRNIFGSNQNAQNIDPLKVEKILPLGKIGIKKINRYMFNPVLKISFDLIDFLKL